MPIEFTSRDFKEGFWSYRPNDGFPSPGLSDPDAYSGQERLNLIEAPSASSKDNLKLRKRWVDILPHLTNVRVLWVQYKVSQAMFEAICEMHCLEALWLKWSGIKSLESLIKLKSLQSLHIGSSTQLESIMPITHLKQLKWLELENIKKIQDISPLGECVQLLGLGIDGSIWTTQRVVSLGPLSRLTELRHLSIINLRSADRSLKPLYGLHKLERLHMAMWWAKPEVEELKHIHPRLQMSPCLTT